MCHEGSYDVSLLTGPGRVTLDRWIIDRTAGKVTQERLDEHFQEFPRVDERVVGRKHRYGYSTVIEAEWQAVLSPTGHFANNAFARMSCTNAIWLRAPSRRTTSGAVKPPGEAVFAPASPNAAEDDAYVMTLVHSLDRGATDLVVLAAQDFTGKPVARVHLPGPTCRASRRPRRARGSRGRTVCGSSRRSARGAGDRPVPP